MKGAVVVITPPSEDSLISWMAANAPVGGSDKPITLETVKSGHGLDLPDDAPGQAPQLGVMRRQATVEVQLNRTDLTIVPYSHTEDDASPTLASLGSGSYFGGSNSSADGSPSRSPDSGVFISTGPSFSVGQNIEVLSLMLNKKVTVEGVQHLFFDERIPADNAGTQYPDLAKLQTTTKASEAAAQLLINKDETSYKKGIEIQPTISGAEMTATLSNPTEQQLKNPASEEPLSVPPLFSSYFSMTQPCPERVGSHDGQGSQTANKFGNDGPVFPFLSKLPPPEPQPVNLPPPAFLQLNVPPPAPQQLNVPPPAPQQLNAPPPAPQTGILPSSAPQLGTAAAIPILSSSNDLNIIADHHGCQAPQQRTMRAVTGRPPVSLEPQVYFTDEDILNSSLYRQLMLTWDYTREINKLDGAFKLSKKLDRLLNPKKPRQETMAEYIARKIQKRLRLNLVSGLHDHEGMRRELYGKIAELLDPLFSNDASQNVNSHDATASGRNPVNANLGPTDNSHQIAQDLLDLETSLPLPVGRADHSRLSEYPRLTPPAVMNFAYLQSNPPVDMGVEPPATEGHSSILSLVHLLKRDEDSVQPVPSAKQSLPSKPKADKESPAGAYMPSRFCSFCKNNGETVEFYTTHTLKDKIGRIVCPTLGRYVCPLCHATGPNAHTLSYCPLYQGTERHQHSIHKRTKDGYARYSHGLKSM